jgi:hypothetical protein
MEVTRLRSSNLPFLNEFELGSIIYQFVCRGIKPGLRYTTLCEFISKGGLGLLEPLIQQRCLQWRWI